MTNYIHKTMQLQSGKARQCGVCCDVYALDEMQQNGVGRPMGICKECYAKLFRTGETVQRRDFTPERIGRIRAAARVGLRWMCRPTRNDGAGR